MENILILETRNQIMEYQYQIEKLFEKIFSRRLMNFKHLFLENPYRCKIICYAENNSILGVGAISYFEFYLDNILYKYYIFTTSMIDESVRSKGVYFKILDIIKHVAFLDGVDFILAFPNHHAYPILSRRSFQLLSRYSFGALDNLKLLKYNYPRLEFNNDYLNWRFKINKYYQFNTKLNSKPVQIIYKIYDQKIDVLHIFYKKIFIDLEERVIGLNEKILVPMHIEDLSKRENPEGIVNMMYFPINRSKIELTFSPILSDVF
ncbi:hypothetical protein C5441_04585 [Campylobacter coli]|nr:hypothetical protein [Campylobacter coli]EAJ2845518.1 hypothetical protein [Campylobacter coli]